ncbi:MAG: AAA family ATPase [Synechococcus sp.]
MSGFDGPTFEELTVDQRAAMQAFADWLQSSAHGVPFVLSGFAGSGKTFLSMRMLRMVEATGLCWTVAAPTHKAVGVLRQALSLVGLQPTWYPSTIHRLLRLKLKRQGDRELCEPTEQTAMALEHLGLVLIDEASMVDSSLLQVALQCAYPFRTHLVFVGDPAQLPPVGEVTSPVFFMERAAAACLQQVVRHQGPVLQLASRIRDGGLACERPPLLPLHSTEQGSVASLDRAAWLVRAQEALKQASVCDNPDAARILCWTNRSLEQLVPHARRAIHGEMADQMPVLPGEVLITRSAVMAPASKDGAESGEEPDLVLGSNREVVVEDVTQERCDLSQFGLSDVDLNGDGQQSLDGFGTLVIDTLNARVRCGELDLSLRLQPPVGSEARQQLDRVLQRLRAQARAAGQRNGRLLWRRCFLIRDAFASLGPAAVLTVHRSQGSSFGEVFVADDVFWSQDLALRRQLVYVAVSRARHGVWLMGRQAPSALTYRWQQILA